MQFNRSLLNASNSEGVLLAVLGGVVWIWFICFGFLNLDSLYAEVRLNLEKSISDTL